MLTRAEQLGQIGRAKRLGAFQQSGEGRRASEHLARAAHRPHAARGCRCRRAALLSFSPPGFRISG